MRYIFLLLIIPSCCYAQKKDSFDTVIIKINATSVLDIFTFPIVAVSAENQISKSVSVSGEIGYQLYSFYQPDTVFIHPSGFKAMMQVRKYFSASNDILDNFGLDKHHGDNLTGFYTGLSLFYRQNKDNLSLDYMRNEDSTNYTDCFTGSKKIVGADLLLGLQIYTSRCLFLDFYAGAGLMYRYSKNLYREPNTKADALNTGPDMNIQSLVIQSYFNETNGVKGTVTLGMRVGIKI